MTDFTQIPNNKVVTRFAPSPTGFLHVGTARTAIFAWLFARKHGGTFILRIEDTDKAREKEGSIEHIIESLTWLGVAWGEGPDIGGPHAPYIQSQRLDTYQKYARVLVEKGFAYPCPYSPEDIDIFKKKAEEEKRPFLMREHRPATFGMWDGTQPLRFASPVIKRYTWQDLSRGELSAGEEALDDIILIKSDGYPTYNFAHIIDDLMMGVTHVIRGQEFISSMPNYLALYEALEITPPQFATMPEILGPDGNKKLSKRDGAKDVLSYRAEGYLPETMVNFLALLGWHPEGDQEVLTVDELTAAFSLERVQKAGAKLDETKLRWLNRQKLVALTPLQFCETLQEYAQSLGKPLPSYIPVIAADLQTRIDTLADALTQVEQGEYEYLKKAIVVTPELLVKNAKADAAVVQKHLLKTQEILTSLEKEGRLNRTAIEEALMPYATEQGRASVLWPLRVALTGREKSPDPFTVIDHLIRCHSFAIVEERIAAAINIL